MDTPTWFFVIDWTKLVHEGGVNFTYSCLTCQSIRKQYSSLPVWKTRGKFAAAGVWTSDMSRPILCEKYFIVWHHSLNCCICRLESPISIYNLSINLQLTICSWRNHQNLYFDFLTLVPAFDMTGHHTCIKYQVSSINLYLPSTITINKKWIKISNKHQ